MRFSDSGGGPRRQTVYQPGDRIQNIDSSHWKTVSCFGRPDQIDLAFWNWFSLVLMSQGRLNSRDKDRYLLDRSFREAIPLEFIPGEIITCGQFVSNPEKWTQEMGFICFNNVRVGAIYRGKDGLLWRIEEREIVFDGVLTPIEYFVDLEDYAFASNFGCLADSFANLSALLNQAALLAQVKNPVLVLGSPFEDKDGIFVSIAPVAIENADQLRFIQKLLDEVSQESSPDLDKLDQPHELLHGHGHLFGLDRDKFSIPTLRLPEQS